MIVEDRGRRSRIKEILDAQGRRYEWFAARMEISAVSFSRIEGGTQPIPPRYYERAAQLLGVPVYMIQPDRVELSA